MDVMSVALGGMRNVQSTLERTAERIAAVSPETSDSVDLSSQMVAMLAARNQFQSNARVIQTADDMQKKLLNLLA
jgi:flagellar basal body rod protein FlgG